MVKGPFVLDGHLFGGFLAINATRRFRIYVGFSGHTTEMAEHMRVRPL